MGEWINRPDLEADWMSLFFLLNLVIILILYKLDPNRLKSLVNFFRPRVYFGKYSHERELNYLSYFNICSLFVIISALALTCFSLSGYSSTPLRYSFEFYYLLLGLFLFLFSRYFLIQFVSYQFDFQKAVKFSMYKNFSLATQISIFLLGLIFLWNYSTLPLILIESVLFLVAFLWFVNQFNIFFSFFKSRPEDLLYIFLYLCTLKLAPWIWVYILFVEAKL